MHYSNLVAIGAFAASATAAPGGSPGQGPTLKPWKVTDLKWSYSPGGTSESFTVKGKADYGMPAFSAICFATGYDKTYQKCHGHIASDGARVSSYFTYGDEGEANIFIKYQAAGKTLIGGQSVGMDAPGWSHSFKVYPADETWSSNVAARDAEDESELVDDEDEDERSGDYRWHVDSLTMGASPGGSWDTVEISAPAHNNIPAFSAKCEATVYQKKWVPCRGANNGHKVSHYWEPTGANKMTVHFKYDVDGKKKYVAQKTMRIPSETVDFGLEPWRLIHLDDPRQPPVIGN